ncbi:integral membrane protein [Oxobacter pfennigii]|uniref:Integral membrane protein n=1 Tax=Oxobacter pfennigii TaxID=36849 RepID=A0A0N8NTQ1_9CLOT|nr:TIGR02206 family membrane protein [Oxobacter pfennigii]KPU45456.1 integral membrane protein [Oxobacter pfennigii]
MNKYFILFSPAHISAMIAIALICLIFYLLRDKIKRGSKRDALRIAIAVILLLQEASFQIWTVSIDAWSVKWTLPLELCSISAILCAVMLLTKSYKIYEIVYFTGIGGAIQAIFTPEIGMYTYPHFRYFQFFTAHGAIILACLFMTFVENYKPAAKSIIKTFIYLNIYAIIIGIFNKLTGSNYMFLCAKPEASSIMDYLGPWPFYIISLEAVAFIIFVLLYVPFVIGGGNSKGRYFDM